MSTVDFGDYTITTTVTPNGQTQQVQWKPGTPGANQQTLSDRAQTALTNNQAFLAKQDPTAANLTYIGLASPTNTQQTAQVKALTQQMNAIVAQNIALTRQLDGVIRLLLGVLDSTSDS